MKEYSSTKEFAKDNYLVSQVRNFTFTLDDISNGSVAIQVNGVAQVPNGDGEVTVASGSTVTLTATPSSGYIFSKWTCTNGTYNNNTDNPLVFTMPFDDIMFEAVFADAAAKYDILVDDDVTGGSIASDVDEAKAGDTVTLTATPAANYVFGAWDVQDDSSNPVTVTDNQFTMPASDVTVTATFKKVHTITYYVGGTTNEYKHTTTRVDGETLSLPAQASAFAGWSTSSSTASPVFVSNTSTVSADMTVYAIFISDMTYDYRLVEASQTDWRGDYLIAYSSSVFADGRVGGTGTGGIGASGVKVNPETKLSGKVVDLTWGDTYNVSLEAINESDLSKGYVLRTKDGKYNYYTSNNNGLSSTETKSTAATYPITVTFTSSSDIKLKLGGNANGAVFRYNTSSTGYFRYYKDGGQSAVYLYKRTGNPVYSLDEYDNVAISSAKYASYCSPHKLDFSGTDVKAYMAKVSGSNVVLTEVEDGIVPANKGVVLYCETADTYAVPVTTSDAGDYDDEKNEMVGVTSHTQVLWNPTDGVYNYILQSGSFKKATDGYLKANRAYLSTSYDVTAAGARELQIVFDDNTTAISTIVNSQELNANGIYDLQGRKVMNPVKGGLYIMNGKKVVIK